MERIIWRSLVRVIEGDTWSSEDGSYVSGIFRFW